MARKIKITIKSEDANINLPAVRFGCVVFLVRTALWGTRFIKTDKKESLERLRQNKKLIIKLIKEIFFELRTMDPFTLIEVNSKDAHVLINIR